MKKLLSLFLAIQLALLLVACSDGNANAVYSDVDDRVGESADSGFKEQIFTDSTDKPEDPLREPYSDRIDYDDGSYKIYDYDANDTLLRETGYFSSGTISFANDYDKNGNCVRETEYKSDGTVKSIGKMSMTSTKTVCVVQHMEVMVI